MYRRFSISIAIRIAGLLISFASIGALTRFLGLSNYGELVAVTAFCSIFVGSFQKACSKMILRAKAISSATDLFEALSAALQISFVLLIIAALSSNI